MNFVHNILLLYRGSLVMDDTFRGKWLTQAGEKSTPSVQEQCLRQWRTGATISCRDQLAIFL
jgi:hypothetical protein